MILELILLVLVVWFLFWYSGHEKARRKQLRSDWEKQQSKRSENG